VYNIFCIGYCHSVGGAGLEMAHTIRLWRKFGCRVVLIPAWGPPAPDSEWPARLTSWGIKTAVAGQLTLRQDVPEIEGSIVCGFCNPHFIKALGRLKVLGCRTVWLPLMNWTTSDERKVFMSTTGLPDVIVFQSAFQKRVMEFNYKGTGYDPKSGVLIRGAFSYEDWPYNFVPRSPSDPFTIIRISRADADKWAPNYYQILDAIDCPTKRAILMGVTDETLVRLGRPAPSYVTHLPPGSVPVQDLYRQAHVHLCTNGNFDHSNNLPLGTPENAPIVARESAASGVPLIAPSAFGWTEIIIHNETGLLANNDAELSSHATLLSRNESLRQHLAANAREHLEYNLANPEKLWSQWSEVFRRLSS
jgi:glycosyltransferase involved in cell wall biosynthesis